MENSGDGSKDWKVRTDAERNCYIFIRKFQFLFNINARVAKKPRQRTVVGITINGTIDYRKID